MVILWLIPRKANCTKGKVVLCTQFRLLLNLGLSRPMRLAITDHIIPEHMDSRAISYGE